MAPVGTLLASCLDDDWEALSITRPYANEVFDEGEHAVLEFELPSCLEPLTNEPG